MCKLSFFIDVSRIPFVNFILLQMLLLIAPDVWMRWLGWACLNL